jgi:hypothetical protein
MAHRESFTEDYKFTVEKTITGGYSVWLPHQCDGWEVLGAEVDKGEVIEHDNGYPNLPKDHAFAVKQMELFVQRAQDALEKLKNLL